MCWEQGGGLQKTVLKKRKRKRKAKLWLGLSPPQLFQPRCQINMTHNTTDPREITGKLGTDNAA